MRNQGSIKILAVDDHPLIRAGLVSFLATEPGLDVVGEAGNGAEAVIRFFAASDASALQFVTSEAF